MPENNTPQRRFKVALSFPGEKREYIKEVAELLAFEFGKDKVFYDMYHRGELGRPNLDNHLAKIYKDEAELIAYFLCEDYAIKEWCGLEYRSIREVRKHKRDHELMPFRFDNTPIDGELTLDGYIPAFEITPKEAADYIIGRIKDNEKQLSLAIVHVPTNVSIDALETLNQKIDQLLTQQQTSTAPALQQQIDALTEEKETLRRQLLQNEEIISQQETTRKELETLLHAETDKVTLKQEALKAVEERDYDKAENLVKEAAAERIQEVADDFYQLGKINELKLDYREALRYYELAVNIQPNNNDYLFKAGDQSDTLGFYDTALEYYERSLFLTVEQYGESHNEVGVLYTNIGLIHSRKGNYDKALEYYFKALTIYEKTIGNDHPETATTYNNIGVVHTNKGSYDIALKYHNKALAIREEVFGKEHLDTACSYNNIGLTYDCKGEYDKALEYYIKTLAINENLLGKEHPNTAISYNNIGEAYRAKGEYDKALEYFPNALAIRKKVLGKDHPMTATSYNNIAVTLHQKGDNIKAIEYGEKAYSISIKVLGPDHPNTIRIKKNLDAYKMV